MNSVSFNGAYHSNLNPQNDKKKNAKRLAAAAIVTTGAVVGGVALYKNRNSKPVQNVASFANDNVINPLKKAGAAVKKKAVETFESIKASVKKIGAKKEQAPNPANLDDIKASAGAAPEIKSTLDVKIKSKKAAKKPVSKKPAAKKNLIIKKKDAHKINKVAPDVAKSNQNIKKEASLFDLAKENSDKLRLAGAGVAAGTVVSTGAKNLAEKIHEQKQLEDKKFIIKMNGKEFKGTFRDEKDGKAHDENGELLNGKVVVVYNGNFGKEIDPNTPRIMKKTIMQYEDGVLKKATHFDDIADKTPAHIKEYKDGKVTSVFEDIILNGRQIAQKTSKSFGIKNSTPMMNAKRYTDENGVAVTEYYKRNEDENGKIIGKPIHTLTIKNEKLGPNHNLATFYAEPKKYGMIDRILKTVETKPNGEVEIVLANRNMEMEDAIGKMTLGPDKKIKEFQLIVPKDQYDTRSANGILSIQDGMMTYSNDDMRAWDNGKKMAVEHPELDAEFGDFGLACFQDANLKMDTLVLGMVTFVDDEMLEIDESYVGKDGDTRVGLVHNDDGTIRAIATYYGVPHNVRAGEINVLPDTLTLFEDGVPVKDIHFDEKDTKIFESGYDFRK